MHWFLMATICVIVIEFSLTILIIISAYLLVFFYRKRKKIKDQLTLDVTNYFANLIPLNQSLHESSFPKKWQRLDIIMPVLDKFTKLLNDDSWKTHRAELIRNVLLPLARTAAVSPDWEMRFYAAVCFGQVYAKEDEPYIIDLVRDEHALIRLNALTAAILHGSESAINQMITIMAEESYLTQSMYLQLFENAPMNTRLFIETRVQISDEIAVKVTCYNILLKYPAGKISWDIDRDIHALDMRLKLAAIRFLAHAEKKRALPILLELLKHPHWQARVVALHALKNANELSAIPLIEEMRTDPNEWVRLFAQDVLNSLNEYGIGVIRTRDINDEKMIFNVALQVLDTY